MIIITQYTDLHRRAAESDAANYFAANPTVANAYYICFADGRVERVLGDNFWVICIDNPKIVNTDSGFPTDLEVIGKDKSYAHRQSEPSQSWQIQHNLGKFPSVTIVDSAKSVLIGEVQYLDSSSLIVSFSAPFSGEAYLN